MRKVVVIGGGTGSYTVLRGLKKYPLQLFSIVNMFDSGGSTGILRDELGVLPPGDVRRCLLALSSDDEKSEILRDLFQFRFEGGVNNHSLGNLILTASEKNYGNIAEGIKKLSKLKPGKGGEIHITDAIQSLINDNDKFIGHNFSGKYLDCGTMKGYINSTLEISKI